VKTKLKKLIFENDVKQLSMARDIGVDPGHLSKIVCGWVQPSKEMRKKIAEYLNVKEDKLFTN
jgi:transcriptional regulator with XRE-family HTH domain